MAERRFRDMRLTEEEVREIVLEHGRFLPSLVKREKRLARAKRLLPLWRDLAIEELHHSSLMRRLEEDGET